MTKSSVLLALVLVAGCTEGSKPDPAAPGGGGKVDDPRPTGGTMHEMSGHHHDGDRMGVHGMVLFGRTHHYLEHIPMFTRPHNEQLVMRVTVRTSAGKLVETDFSDAGFSVEPTSPFSLDDVTLQKKLTFTGDVHRGNFEEGGPVVLRGAKITIEDVLIARNLPGTEPIASTDQEYFLIGEPDDAYLTNYIRADRGFQQILRVDTIEGVTPSLARVQRLTMKAAQRLAPTAAGTFAAIPKAGVADGTRVALTIGAELWCLNAPDFVEHCP